MREMHVPVTQRNSGSLNLACTNEDRDSTKVISGITNSSDPDFSDDNDEGDIIIL